MPLPLAVPILRASDGAEVLGVVEFVTGEVLAQARAWHAALVQSNAPDQSWDWEIKLDDARAADATGQARFESLSLRVGDELEAIMLLEVQAHRGRTNGKPLVYVEYLAVAPFNRSSAVPRRYKKCGEAMLVAAFTRSRDLGFRGRIGLHALPTSVEFYRRIGLVDLGEDAEEGGLRGFESPEDMLESG